MKRTSIAHSRRASIISRVAAALVGTYVVVSLVTAAASLTLPGSPGEAVRVATMASFLVWAVIVMAVCHARSATRAWAWLIGAALPLGLVVWLLMPGARA